MDNATFILVINFSVGGIFALVFTLIAAYDRAYSSARWFAASFVMGMVDMALEFLLPHLPEQSWAIDVGIFASYLLALSFGVVGLSRRYGIHPPFLTLAGIFVVAVAVNVYIYLLPRDDAARLFLYQAPYVLVQLIGAVIVFRNGGRRPLELTLGTVLALSASNYLVKPFIAWSVGGTGSVPGAYIHTPYALYSQTFGAILSLGLGILFVVVYMRDMLADIRAVSETDRLSALLNRRGFETRAETAIARDERAHVPSVMVLSDLDHFKMINDEFGHAAGDKVIELFAGLVRDALTDGQFAGRIGGEEFTVYLPAANLTAGRLFAETVRSTFATMQDKELPFVRRITASFGVAERMPGEDISSLLRRADLALYEAKRAGRNRVCVAPEAVPRIKLAGDRRQFRGRN